MNLFKRAAIFTDIHFGLKSNSQLHNEDCLNFIKWATAKAQEEGCETCLFLGDWHNHRASINVVTLNYSLRALEHINKNFEKCYFIPGNHDLLKLSDYRSLGFQIYPDYQKCGPFLLTHIPPEKPDMGRLFLSGHVHHSVRVKGKAKQTMRLPCFFKSSEQLILPAMGIFTGTFTLRQNKPENRAYAIAGNAIFEMEKF